MVKNVEKNRRKKINIDIILKCEVEELDKINEQM